MSFYATSFTYDGISSELYGLICASNDTSGSGSSSAGSDISILEDYLPRRETPYFYGVSFPTKLEFPVRFMSEDPIPRNRVSEIEKWLFGNIQYKELRLIQEDMDEFYFNCFFTSPTVVSSGNEIVGFQATATCDAPWGWGTTVTVTKTGLSDTTTTIINLSDNNRYTKPEITLTFATGQDEVTLVNSSDTGSTAMVFEDVTSGEIITINNDLRMISSNRELIVDRFNGKYLYLIPGTNTLTITGTIATMVISYIPAKKVGS